MRQQTTLFSVTFSDRPFNSKQSLLLEVHLKEEKKRVLTMFILFMKTMSLVHGVSSLAVETVEIVSSLASLNKQSNSC